MEFQGIFDSFKKQRVAAVVYEKGGRARYRDRLTLGRNGKVLFERFNYGEAAGLVFSMWGVCGADGAIDWDTAASADYSRKDEAPRQLTGNDADSLLFDGAAAPWAAHTTLKSWPAGGLSKLSMLFSGN
ncbi:hypothetical protein LJC60_10345 [Ruminococcaceae bacterium OttesenSCG-928-D13]|nr:hypothetical protein [Ruminococcaceae bacterium OttesenSCG-928-D13]